MNCQTCLELLQRELDGCPPGVAPEHLAGCPTCRALYRAAGLLREGLRRDKMIVPAPDFTATIVGRVLADRRTRRRRRLLVGAAALAATVLLGLALSMSLPARLPHSPADPPIVAAEPIPEAPSGGVALRDSIGEMGSAVVALTAHTADETVAQSRLLLPVVSGPVFGELDLPPMVPDSTTDSLREAGQNLTSSLEPVTSTARRAFGLLLRDLPPMDAEAKPGP